MLLGFDVLEWSLNLGHRLWHLEEARLPLFCLQGAGSEPVYMLGGLQVGLGKVWETLHS